MKNKDYKPINERVEVEVEVELEEKKGYIRDFITGRWLKNTPEEEIRQILERKLVEEYGYSKSQIEIEFPIQKGSQKIGLADIVVFRDEKKSFDNLYIIVEVKRKERKDGIEQLKSYLSPTNAEYGIWFNGKDIAYLRHLKEPPYFDEGITDIPKKGQTSEDVGLYQKKDLKPATELKTVFETIHNYIYANEGLLKEKVFNEMLKLIFIKMADEKALAQECEFRITNKELQELREGKENGFMDRINKLFDRVKNQYSDVFEPHEKLNLKPLTIAFIVSQLQKYSLIDTPADVKGIAFQTFVYAHQRGERGEFFTPHPIVELCVNMLDPKDNERLIDPACGSGGFLVAGMNYIKEKFIKERPELKDKATDFLKEYAHAYISGIDINPDLAKVAKMHMVLYDDGHSGIFCADSLLDFNELIKIAEKSGVPRALRPEPGNFQVLMTNPPFGSKGKVTDKRILQNFELGYKWKKQKDGRWIRTNEILGGQAPEILFIERSLQLLAENGRMAIVLPNGILNNSSLGYVREFIRQNSRILAVVSLPDGTFNSAGANPKSSVLFLQKLSKEKAEELNEKGYPIFMAIVEKIGYDLTRKTAPPVYKRDEKGRYITDEKGNKILDTDIPEIIKAFKIFKQKHGLGF
jgi:type I restriction enzyme M protein